MEDLDTIDTIFLCYKKNKMIADTKLINLKQLKRLENFSTNTQ